jgi:hypothetical protein
MYLIWFFTKQVKKIFEYYEMDPLQLLDVTRMFLNIAMVVSHDVVWILDPQEGQLYYNPVLSMGH